jgi:glycosyltransferase involved in cell wall biosynthesis
MSISVSLVHSTDHSQAGPAKSPIREDAVPISVVVLTLDEADNLPDCLASVSWCDDIVVVDSESTDGTGALAEQLGARLYSRPFDGFAAQRNYVLDEISLTHPWVFFLDADERFTPALLAECHEVIEADCHSAYLVPSKLIYMGRWLRYAGDYPIYQTRLVKAGEMRFVQAGHAQREGEAERGVGMMHSPYLHLNFSKGLETWFDKHNRYSSEEAAEVFGLARGGRVEWKALVANDPVARRRALRDVGWHLPGRPLIRFLYMYVVRRGFLDGRAGLNYCLLVATYEEMISLKLAELRRSAAAGAAT